LFNSYGPRFLGQVFSDYFGIWGCITGQILAHVPSGLNITQPYKIEKAKEKINTEIYACMNAYAAMKEEANKLISQ
jgi:hypothetical protein